MIAALVIIFIQSVLGTMVRMYVDDISQILQYEKRNTWLADSPVAFLVHRTFSWIVLLSTLFLAWTGKKSPIRDKLFVLTAIILSSMITGIVLFYADMPAVAQPIHLLLATLAITQCFSMLLQTKVNKA